MASGAEPDFVITADGELVSSRDLHHTPGPAEGTGDLVGDLVLAGPPAPAAATTPPADRPEHHAGQAPGSGPVPRPAGPPSPPMHQAPAPPPRAPAPPVQAWHSSGPHSPPPVPRPPNPADGTPMVIAGRPVSSPSQAAPSDRDGPKGPTGPSQPADSVASGLEIDSRSLAEQTFDHLPSLESQNLSPRVPGSRRPSLEKTGPETPGWRPASRPRPIRERNRSTAPSVAPMEAPAPATRGPMPSWAQTPAAAATQDPRAEQLYREAIKAASVGDVGSARRHLQLALTYAPRNPRYQRALERLGQPAAR